MILGYFVHFSNKRMLYTNEPSGVSQRRRVLILGFFVWNELGFRTGPVVGLDVDYVSLRLSDSCDSHRGNAGRNWRAGEEVEEEGLM